MADDLIPVHNLDALDNRFLGGDFYDSEPQLVVMFIDPHGVTRVEPVHGYSAAKDPKEVFPRNDIENTKLRQLNAKSAATLSLKWSRENQYQDRRETLTVISRLDGIYAVYRRDKGESGYDLFDSSKENSIGKLPTDPSVPFGRIWSQYDKGEEHIETTESEEEYYGETRTVERVTDMWHERETTYLASEARLFSVGGERRKRGTNPNEGLAAETVEKVRKAFDVPVRDDEPPCIEYIIDPGMCECESRSASTLVERLDKDQIMRCSDCHGTFTTRNKRELADGLI